ncbi:DUF2975 domain-containing protein [Flavobacterium ardleyense]|uniref:DUF2975 domain-containing protein n=1 Tax=Flavobacterium ardleyense TaxID=2038737 RepID=A0ABW5Z7T4_9FLAO
MKKLNFLKAIIDFVWIMAMVTIPIILFLSGYIIFGYESFDLPIKINGNELLVVDLESKIILACFMISSLLIIYSLYLFKKLLRLFQLKIIFDLEVVQLLNKIGLILISSAIISGVSGFIFNFLKRNISLSFELNSNVLLFSLGLFFIILSEVFIIAKSLKEENDLTF